MEAILLSYIPMRTTDENIANHFLHTVWKMHV